MQIQTSPPPPIPVNFLVPAPASSLIPASPSISSSPPPPSSNRVETLSSLCQWWGDTKQEPLPSICHQFVSPSDRLDGHWAVVPPQFYSHGHNQLVRHPAPSHNLVSTPFGTGRSISLIGILGGVLFILLIVAFITCIRRRKRWSGSVRDAESDGDLLAAHLHQLQQLRSSHQLLGAREAPPDYTTVCKQKEEEEEGGLPSYSQAVLQERGPGSSRSSRSSRSLQESGEEVEVEEVEGVRAGTSREE